jgi:hypothetical protein
MFLKPTYINNTVLNAYAEKGYRAGRIQPGFLRSRRAMPAFTCAFSGRRHNARNAYCSRGSAVTFYEANAGALDVQKEPAGASKYINPPPPHHLRIQVAFYSMSEIKDIAIAGASGYVGRPIVEELLKAGNFELRILTRKSGVRMECFAEIWIYTHELPF